MHTTRTIASAIGMRLAPARPAETVTFGLDARFYEIDLSEEHAKELNRTGILLFTDSFAETDSRRMWSTF